ncbi:hypothetical protein LCGC14_2567820 [marine sediment metagenome]|uniref:Uncharacterized protein n=1 Tax=marine sediment metagenome TaxID=412755 RepID=A0A0F9CU90_9ZZZZ
MSSIKSSIKISQRLKDFLSNNSTRKGETYEDIIWRLLSLKVLTKEQGKIIKAKYEELL